MVVHEQIFAPCIWDCRAARAAKLAGFKAALLSGGQLAESVARLPDIGLITADEYLKDIELYGFNFITCHYMEKASMYEIYDYSKRVQADRNTVYADEHDMGGMLKQSGNNGWIWV